MRGTRKWAKFALLRKIWHLECRAWEWTAQDPVGVAGFVLRAVGKLIHLSRDSTVWLSLQRASALRCAGWMARGSDGWCVEAQWERR